MRRTFFGPAWLFILLAAFYDGYFAWQHRGAFQHWELNLLACWLVRVFGMKAALGFKAVSMGFAAALAVHCHQRQHRLELPLTLVICGFYGLLTLHYLVNDLHLVGAGPQLAEQRAVL